MDTKVVYYCHKSIYEFHCSINVTLISSEINYESNLFYGSEQGRTVFREDFVKKWELSMR